MLCGNPEEVIEQLRAYEATGVDQVSFGFPATSSHEDALECIETFGKHVIPEFDKDPVHSTTHYRNTAVKPQLDLPTLPCRRRPRSTGRDRPRR